MSERDLFLAALEIDDPAARQAQLQTACAGDAELLARVESLLASHESQSRFLVVPVAEQFDSAAEAGSAATILIGDSTTHDDEAQASGSASSGKDPMQYDSTIPDDEIPLRYLQPSTRPDSLGRLGHYEILEVVGRGAFGTVLRAFDDTLQRVVAIKVMAPELAATSPARKRFLREAVASAQIRHENVVSVYAVEERPIPYLVMEYIPGVTLQKRLDERGPLDVSTVLRLGIQICEGLAAAHAKDLIHRDVKPGNILLESGTRDRVKITDFGLARAADDASMTQSGMIAGTPMYMAPEQALGHKLDQRADLFSLGSVLYQMVSGRPPFRASTTLAVLKRVTEETPRPIPEIIPETPQWLCDIIAKLHAKNPDDRYQSAREVADVLTDCEAQLRANTRLKDFSRIPRQRPASPGKWKWAAAAAVAVLLPILALAVAELTGTTGLFRGQETTVNPNGPTNTTPVAAAKPGVPDSNGFVQLFNGKDLTGWKTHPEQPGQWKVERGALVGSTVPSFLFSDGTYGNFHLRLEAKINQGGDGGVFFRVPFSMREGRTAAQARPAAGYEVELQQNPEYIARTGSVSDAETAGPPQLLWKNELASLTSADEWFTLEIIADGNRIISKVNGTQTADCRDPRSRYDAGHLALQVYNSQTIVQFRKIEIKELPASPPVTDGFVQLFNGQDLTGWNTRPAAPGNWEVKDGILIGSQRPGDLYSERGDFANFHLRVQAKVNLGGDSGVFFRAGSDARLGEGYEAEIHKNRYARKTGTIMTVQANGPPLVLGRVADDSLTRPDEWFDLEIIAQQGHFITKVNGQETANCSDPANQHAAGHLGLQVWSPNTVVQFRKIEIKELPASPPATDGFVALFNGKDLTGWKTHSLSGGEWKVENGAIDGRGTTSYLFSESGEYDNFHLRVEAKINGNGDAGVYIRTPFDVRPLPISGPAKFTLLGGYEAALALRANYPTHTGALTAADGSILQAGPLLPHKPDEWFVLEVIAEDNHIRTLVDGKPTADYHDEERRDSRGHIALQTWGPNITSVQFRKIEIKELPASTSPSVAPAFAVAPFDAAQARAHQEAWAKHLGVQVEKELILGTDQDGKEVRLSMVLIPPGEFLMGSSDEERVRLLQEAKVSFDQWAIPRIPSEGPQHRVRIMKPFWLSKCEINIRQFRRFVQAASFKTEAERDGKGGIGFVDGNRAQGSQFVWSENPGFPQSDDHPVVNVAWPDSKAFCDWLSQQQGPAKFALPTEAQWEYACRAGTTTTWHTGDSDKDVLSNAWLIDNAERTTQPVGQRAANGFGLHDMHGNVGEWCADWYSDSHYAHSATNDPVGPTTGITRVIRGGQFDWNADHARSAFRVDRPPTFRQFNYGFRVAAAISDSEIEAKTSPPTTPTPNVAVVDGLRALAVEKENFRNQIQQEHVAGKMTALDVLYAEIDLCEARIHLTKAEGDAVAHIAQYRRLVSLREQESQAITEQVKEGQLKADEQERADSSLVDARGRLAKALAEAPADAFFTDADVKRIAALPAEQQVAAVVASLKERNPGLNGTASHKIVDGVVTEFNFNPTDDQNAVTDVSPVRALAGLTSLNLWNCSALADLGPLQGLPLTRLLIGSLDVSNQVRDLKPLQGMRLTELQLYQCQVEDLKPLAGMPLIRLRVLSRHVRNCEPLKGMPLTTLDLSYCTQIQDFTPLTGLPLTALHLNACQIRDLQPLLGLKLTEVSLAGTRVQDLQQLKGMPLKNLAIHRTGVTDLTPLQGMELKEIFLTPKNITQGVNHLRDMQSLNTIGIGYTSTEKWPAAEFWDRYEKREFAIAPFTEADAQRIAALPAAEQVEEVRKELVRLNPGFDGKVTPTIDNGVVAEFSVNTDEILDVTPVRALTKLVYLDIRGTYPNKGKLTDISPLRGMTISRLDCSSTQISDLSPLADLPLTFLAVNHNPVSDLSPIVKMPLESLAIAETKVSDLSPLKGMKIKVLGAQLLPVTDLSPLAGMPLTGIDLYHTVGVTTLEPLRGMPLEGLNLQDVPVSDLSPLQDMTTLRTLQLVANKVSDLSPLAGLKLTDLILHGEQITDLTPLKGLPLSRLMIDGTGVSDLRPLAGMPLVEFRLNPKNITEGMDVLRAIPSLKTIGIDGNQARPSAEFWERHDKGEFK